MKKIGLITIYHVPNYGSVLQAYATQTLIEKNGFECVMLNYKYPNEWHYQIDPSRKNKSLKSKIAHLFNLSANHRKANLLTAFRKKQFHFSKCYHNLDELKNENWKDYSAFMVGSDQVWKAQYTLGDSAFLLSFIPDNKFRFSFASSFAAKRIPNAYKEKYKKYLSKFSYLSTREQNGIEVVRDLGINIDVKVVLDPTLVLNKEEWLNLIPRSNFKKKKKYILLYLLTYAFEPRPYIFHLLNYLKNKYGYEIIALEGYTKMSKASGVKMKDKTDSTIPEFIDLFNQAEMVVTTSFHGTAFALNFDKPLISIVPDNKEDDRQSSLLKQLNLKQCIAQINTPFEKINPFYNLIDKETKLNQLRSQSINWLVNILSNI